MAIETLHCPRCGNSLTNDEPSRALEVFCPKCQGLMQPAMPEGVAVSSTIEEPLPEAGESIFQTSDEEDDFITTDKSVLDLMTSQTTSPDPLPSTPVATALQNEVGDSPIRSDSVSNQGRSRDDHDLADLRLLGRSSGRTQKRHGVKSGLLIALVIIPLISYAILATIAVLILYYRAPQPSLEWLPDLEGDFKGVKKQGSVLYRRVDPDSPLPSQLQVGLGQTVRVGELEITPVNVERRPIRIRYGERVTEPSDEKALVLQLRLKNVSQASVFCPTDPYFARQWREGQSIKPYTFVESGRHRVYGGPIVWRPDEPAGDRECVDGQSFRELSPGEELMTIFCTNPGAEIEKLLDGASGTITWRVQVRRGLVHVADRDVSATAVVGIRFTRADVEIPG